MRQLVYSNYETVIFWNRTLTWLKHAEHSKNILKIFKFLTVIWFPPFWFVLYQKQRVYFYYIAYRVGSAYDRGVPIFFGAYKA